ncbi:hypothetical protein MBLNU13_g11297t1 [Cladosporium sp. NU13]
MGSFNVGHCVQRKEKRTRDGQARVARCKTWRIVDDGNVLATRSESPAQKRPGAVVSEVKVEPCREGEDLTSFLPFELNTVIGVGLLLKPTDTTDNFSFLDSTTTHELDISTAPDHFNRTQPSEINMNSLNKQGRKRIKYKEPPVLEATTTAAPNSNDAQPSRSHSSPLTEPSRIDTHSINHDLPAPLTACITSPLEITPDAIERATSRVPYASSSAASEHEQQHKNPTPIAAEMGGNKKPQGHKKKQLHPLTEDDQEFVFQGRSVGRSDVTKDSWSRDPALGALISNTSGASYQTAPCSKALPQKPVATSKPDAASISSTKLENPIWAKKTSAKATKPREDWASTNNNNDWGQQHDKITTATGGWDTGHPPYPSTARLNAEAANSKDQAHTSSKPFNQNGRFRKPRESPWIKDSLIPKGDPNRHKVKWSSSESSSFDSNRASSGWGTRKKRDQHDNGAELADWAGGIGPASIDWDSRSKFRDHQSVAKIESWLDQNLIALEQIKATDLTDDDSAFPFTTTQSGEHVVALKDQGDIAPRYWFVAHLDGKSAKFFWLEHIDPQGDDVKPSDEEDLQGATPWWDSYVDNEHIMLKPFKHPEEVGIDPDDENAEQRLARENDQGAANAGEIRKAVETAKREAQRKRALAKREKAHKLSGTHDSSASNTIKPGLNMFLRAAVKGDMVPLRDIYNRYIDNAFVVPETNRLTETDMLARWQAIKKAKLPFIVACQRGEVVKARGKKFNAEDMIMPDKVIGFACAADWSDGTCIYRPTVKLEVFVHMEQYMKHIGSCLADKMMGLLDPQFIERGGYDVADEELERVDASRNVSNVLVRYSYDAKKTDKLKWVSKWFKTRYGFEQVADLQGVAQKFDEQLNLAILQKSIN